MDSIEKEGIHLTWFTRDVKRRMGKRRCRSGKWLKEKIREMIGKKVETHGFLLQNRSKGI